MVYRKRKYNQAFSKAARFVGGAYQVARQFKKGRSYQKNNRKKTIYGGGVSTQHDQSMQYRRKNMPRYKKNSWKNFTKKVKAVIGASLGTYTIVSNSSGDFKAAGDAQEFGSFVLCGRGGEDKFGDVGNRDLEDIASATPLSGQIMLRSAILDCTFTNIGSTKIEMDIYHVRYGNENQSKNLSEAYNESYNRTVSTSLIVQTGTTGSNLTMASRGATPFNFPQAISACGMKILKKTKYFVPVGDCITYQLRDPRNYTYKRSATAEGPAGQIDNGFVIPYKTQGLIVVIKNIIRNAGTPAQLSYGVTRSYTYAIQESDQTTKLALSRTDASPP